MEKICQNIVLLEERSESSGSNNYCQAPLTPARKDCILVLGVCILIEIVFGSNMVVRPYSKLKFTVGVFVHA